MGTSGRTLLAVAGIGMTLACSEQSSPTQPDTPELTSSLAAAAGSWTSKAPMSTGRYKHIVGTTGSQQLYVFGGKDADDASGNSMERSVLVYNPATNSWTSRSQWPGPMADVNGIGFIAGKFYLPGGGDETGNGFDRGKSLSIYNVAKDSWTLGASMPQESSGGVSGVIDGKLYVLTGVDNVDDACGGECGGVATRRLFRYDPATNSWVSRRSPPNFHIGGAAGVIGGKLYVAGGGNNKLDIYDPVTNTWSPGRNLPKTLHEMTGVVVGAKLYVIQGGTGEVYAYNPTSNWWSAQPSVPTPRRWLAAGRAALDGAVRIFAIGGFAEDDTATGNEMFTP